jgi:hypothetical protein
MFSRILTSFPITDRTFQRAGDHFPRNLRNLVHREKNDCALTDQFLGVGLPLKS